jgi:NAD-dependent dihydropyrimidine dehydrogenase PreA subunit
MASLYAIIVSLFAIPITFLFAPFNLLSTLGLIWILTCGAYLLVPYLPSKSGFKKTFVYGLVCILTLMLIAFFTTGSVLGYPWELFIAIIVVILLGVDLNGMTPILPSDLGHLFFRRGHSQMPFFTGKYPLQPYGKITQDYMRCNGCGICIQVCPMNVYEFDAKNKKANLIRPKICVNCNACVHRCPQLCLQIVET